MTSAKHALRTSLIAAALLILALAPVSGRADDLVPHSISAECSGELVAPGTGSCSTTFHFDKDGLVSDVDTHGNFHALLSQAGGVTLKWFDPHGTLIFIAACDSSGASVGGVGPEDIQAFTCTNNTRSDKYLAGDQTLVVEAATQGCLNSGGDTGCVFHGKLSLSAPGALL